MLIAILVGLASGVGLTKGYDFLQSRVKNRLLKSIIRILFILIVLGLVVIAVWLYLL